MVEPLGAPLEQPAAMNNETPTTKGGIALIMGLFVAKIALCRV
jgi:hypothetical protein